MNTYISKKSILSAISAVRDDLKRRKKNSRAIDPSKVVAVLRSRIPYPFDEKETVGRISRYVA